jgi:hypothetical protein
MKSIFDNRFVIFVNMMYNIIAFPFAYFSYHRQIVYFMKTDKVYLIPLLPVCFYLFFSFSIYYLLRLLKYPVPQWLTSVTFYLNFVYGHLCLILYPCYMFFVSGLSWYYSWCIITHGYIAFLSYTIYPYVKNTSLKMIASIAILFVFKNYADLYLNTLNYLSHPLMIPYYTLSHTIVYLGQIFGIYLLFRRSTWFMWLKKQYITQK